MTAPVIARLDLDGAPAVISGIWEPRFQPVVDAFIGNFRDRRELGAAVAVQLEGRVVVDVWGGHRDPARTSPWERDTICSMASTVKGVMAMGLHLLADRGRIDYDQPVAAYWHEFAESGKEKITVRQAISHHAALHFADAAEPGDMIRWYPLVRAVAAQRPEWEPGTRGVDHTITIIPILGHLIELGVGGNALGVPLQRDHRGAGT